tara:strand:+ start:3616 stop:3807 length:192 start_codon:yes stop_codon:yes gene_type:complete
VSRRKFNSIEQAAKASRLATIELAAQRAAFKANGGAVEFFGVTRSHTFTIGQQVSIVMSSEGK